MFALNSKLTPCETKKSKIAFRIESSSPAKILSPRSKIVTFAPSFAKVEANSRPINPPPIIARLSIAS